MRRVSEDIASVKQKFRLLSCLTDWQWVGIPYTDTLFSTRNSIELIKEFIGNNY